MRAWASTLLPVLLAVIVPLAGLILALHALATGDREQALRIGLATLLGAFIWTAVLTA